MSYVVLITHADRSVEVVGAFADGDGALAWVKDLFTHPDLYQLQNCHFRVKEMRSRADVEEDKHGS